VRAVLSPGPCSLVVDNIDLFLLVWCITFSIVIQLSWFLLHLVLDSIIFNLNINTKFLEFYTSCSFWSYIYMYIDVFLFLFAISLPFLFMFVFSFWLFLFVMITKYLV